MPAVSRNKKRSLKAAATAGRKPKDKTENCVMDVQVEERHEPIYSESESEPQPTVKKTSSVINGLRKDIKQQRNSLIGSVKSMKRKATVNLSCAKARAALDSKRRLNEGLIERPESTPPSYSAPETCQPPRPVSADIPRIPPIRCIDKSKPMAKRTLSRRKSEFNQLINDKLPGMGFRLTNSPKKTKGALTAAESLEILCTTSCTWSVFRKLGAKGVTASARQVRKVRAQILAEMPETIETAVGPDGAEVPCVRASLIDSMEYDLSSLEFMQKLPDGPIRIVVSGDAGGDGDLKSTSIGFYYDGLPKAVSAEKVHLLACFCATDSRDYIEDVFDIMYHEMEDLAQGIETADGHRDVIVYFVADFKFIYAILGLLGPTSLFPCPFCLVTKQQMKAGEVAEKRSFEHMMFHGKAIEELGGPNATSKEKDEHFSMKRRPLLPPNVILVPPPMHSLSGVINRLILEAKRDEPEALNDLMAEIGVFFKKPANELTGSDGSALVKTIVDLDLQLFPNFALLETMSRILPFCEAKDYEQDEIDILEAEIKEFMSMVRQNPEISITPKFHVLEAHIVPFMREHRSLGKFSEQGFEGVHKEKNQWARKFPKRRKGHPMRVMKSFFERHALGNYFHGLD